jgi:exosortase/archaeosortase family protein
VVWGGAIVCIEDLLEKIDIKPSSASLIAGMILIAYVIVRSIITLDKDTGVYILPLIAGIGLALMAFPVRKLGKVRDALATLALFPIQEIMMRTLPDYTTSVVTGRLAQLLLLGFGSNAALNGRTVNIGREGVYISGACNSIDQMALATVVCCVFTLAFPIQSGAKKLLFILSAPIVALAFNSMRIAILAAINASGIKNRGDIFNFLHDEWGALGFGALAVMVLGQVYLMMVEEDIKAREGNF